MFKDILKILIKFKFIISLVSFLCILNGNFVYTNGSDDLPLPDGNDIPKEVILFWVFALLMMWLIPRHNEFERLIRSVQALENDNGEQPLVKYKVSNPPTDLEMEDICNKFVSQIIENNFHSVIFVVLDFLISQIIIFFIIYTFFIIFIKLILYFYPNFKNYIDGFNIEDIFYNTLCIAQPLYLLHYYFHII